MIADQPLHSSTQDHPTALGIPVVYFVTSSDVWDDGWPTPPQVVKIGTTVDVPGRMKRMHRSRGPGFQAVLVGWCEGGEELERELHLRHRAHRVGASGDWFWVHPGLLDNMGELVAAQSEREEARS